MQFLLNQLAKNNEFNTLITAVKKSQLPVNIWGAPDYLRASYCYALCKKMGKKALVIVPDEELESTYLSLIAHFGDGVFKYLPKEYQLLNVDTVSHSDHNSKISLLTGIIENKIQVAVTTIDAVMELTIERNKLKNSVISIKTSDIMPLDRLAKSLVELSYVQSDRVEGIGQFCIRGGICDFFSPNSKFPVRIELFGDEVDQIYEFSVLTQRREERLESTVIAPATELLHSDMQALVQKLGKIKNKNDVLSTDIEKLENGIHISVDRYLPLIFEENTSIVDYFKDDLVLAFEYSKLKDRAKGSANRLNEDIKSAIEEGLSFCGKNLLIEYDELLTKLQKLKLILMQRFSGSINDINIKTLISVNSQQTELVGNDIESVVDDIFHTTNIKGSAVVVAVANLKHAETISKLLEEKNIKSAFTTTVPDILNKGEAIVVPLPFTKGYTLNDFAIYTAITSTKIREKRRLKRHNNSVNISSLDDLKIGDYIVHSEYGIGVFQGIVTTTRDGITKDSLKIKYSGTDILYVPCTRLDLVSKYLGADRENGIKLNKLTKNDFAKTKERVRGAVKELAKELIALYSERIGIKGYAHASDTPWQAEFEDSFEFEETDDQLISTREIKDDMEKPVPMERLLCGDVGVGKTEVAIRAAFKSVSDDKQVAVLVPTTVLAMQHYRTFTKRMAAFPVKIEMLSRFATKKQEEDIKKRLRRGQIDILIGTHKIIQKNIVFKDLGLAIIDEEQRFGVSHKEKLKEMTKSVDVLTLSATPIPRTLNMALTGIRDMSVIEEPPHNRSPISTYVLEFDLSVICDAITKEVSRGGQVYYLTNRIETIYSKASKLKELLPNLEIDVAHGKMSQSELSNVWIALLNKEIDVLFCTTIIETGVDVPNVNTLIIEDADKLGLAQLHQIRGRVGRSARKAYAYLTYNKGKVLSEDATKRLTAIRNFTEFGSGLKIAMRDLEIRGAGNMLGAQQSGHMEAVGYELYSQILSEAITQERGENIYKIKCKVDLDVTAFIPKSYISSSEDRIDAYKTIAAINNKQEESEAIDELIDRYGDMPKEVVNLVKIASLKAKAATLFINEIIQKNASLYVYREKEDLELVSKVISQSKTKIVYAVEKRPFLSVSVINNNPIATLEEFLELIEKLL